MQYNTQNYVPLEGLGEPVFFSNAPSGEVSMVADLSGPYLRTFRDETYIYDAQPFEDLIFSYTPQQRR